jgi:hypothetical protein
MSFGMRITMADGLNVTSGTFRLPRVLFSQVVPPQSSVQILGFDITRGFLTLNRAPNLPAFPLMNFDQFYVTWNPGNQTASWTSNWLPPGQFILTAIVF